MKPGKKTGTDIIMQVLGYAAALLGNTALMRKPAFVCLANQ